MQCPETARCLPAYIVDELISSERETFEAHLLGCGECSAELASLAGVKNALHAWGDAPLPASAAAHRERVRSLAEPVSSRGAVKESRWPTVNWWQWAPSAISFVLLAILLVDARFLATDDGISLSFGGQDNANKAPGAEEMISREEVQQLIARVEQRQDENTIALMQAVLSQTRESNEASLQQLFAFFEQQRLNDLEQVRASYDQLASSDFETLRSLQQLASYVSFNESVR